jgi:hypothetical protein
MGQFGYNAFKSDKTVPEVTSFLPPPGKRRQREKETLCFDPESICQR